MKIIKNGLITMSLAILLAFSGAISGISITSDGNLAGAASCTSSDAKFFDFPTWYRGLNCEGGAVKLDGEPIGQIILTVALNILDIALRLLTFVAIGFTIFGGFQYMLARGEPAGVAKGKTTLTNAIIGLIIGVVSSAAVSFIVARLNA